MLPLLAHSLLKQWAELTELVDLKGIWTQMLLVSLSKKRKKKEKKETKQNRGMCALLQETGNFTSVS